MQFGILYFAYYLFAMLYGAYAYIGLSLGGFRMMRSAGVKNPWMAWVPYCNIYALGNLADTSCSLREGKATTYRKKLLTWSIVSTGATFLWSISLVVLAVLAVSADQVVENGYATIPEYEVEAMVAPVLIFLLLTGVFLALYVVYTVYYYIVLHKIYKLYAPSGAAGLTVLSIFVSVAVPAIFLVLSGRKPHLPFAVEETPLSAPSDMEQDYSAL